MIDFLEHGSYAGIIILLVLTGAGLPIPEEVFVIGAGIASSHGKLNWALAFASCLIGALLGDLITYGIGRHFGQTLLREHHWFIRYISPAREREIESAIHRYGTRVFFLSRFMPGLRSPVYLTAGIVRFPFTRFLIVDSICATTVIGTFFGLSYFFADQINQWWHTIRNAEVGLSIIAVLGVVGCAGYWYWRHRKKQASGLAEADISASLSQQGRLDALDNDPTAAKITVPDDPAAGDDKS